MDKKDLLLKARNIHKSYDVPKKVVLLKGVDLEVYKGESVAITGRSGEGKSTLLQILGTLENPSKGNVEIVGQKVSSFNKTSLRNQHIGFVFQFFHLLEDCSALENVLMPAYIARKPVYQGTPTYERALQLLEEVELQDRAHFCVKQLSGGEKQRVAIARALCNDPELIFADEPSGNLDHQTSLFIHNLLLELASLHKKALVIVTHDRELANLCQRRYCLQDGLFQDLS